VVHGKIARFANFGAFVELDDNLEGLCHISELSDERVAKPSDIVELGQEMEFKVLRIDPENRRIGLSARAVGKEDEPIINTKTYSSEVGSGMASLGELADFGINRNTLLESSEARKEEAKESAATEDEPPAPTAAAAPDEAAGEDAAVEASSGENASAESAVDSESAEATSQSEAAEGEEPAES